MNANPPITIKHIARKFKCSPSTVSRALNNHPLINEDTRRNIQEYAQQVGYQRNSVALSLLNQKSAMLGVIVPSLNHFHETAMIEGLQHVLQARGYMLTICVTNESYALEKEYVDKLLANRVEGIFLSVAQETYDSGHSDHLANVLKRQIPLIFIDREYNSLPAGSITVDDYWGAFEATEHLILSGGKRIAHLKGPNGLTLCERRFQGYKDCLHKHNISIDESLIINTNFKADSAIGPMRSLMALENPPDSVFGVNDVVASAAMQVIREMGFSIPDQVAVIGFDNSPFSAYLNPGLSTVNRFGKLIGEKATGLFLDALEREKEQQETIVLRPELVIRNSTLRYYDRTYPN
ncbi:LacI family DNA-binding transcriptional regulator [Fibrella forsythiae]|uniref:LacI family DNA-binding transcriptional regulator n=1 Tax=Fibrella forsythiae TaxID=2817061 RepID=A0ABS3JMH9_9BACT|nr:LacI family DNA-binding transcriptional regulator [Fibrella forsythiae]MBO0951232.1 LacI family DNA-binding transcriptional regulator [Fibrella forsythiae]